MHIEFTKMHGLGNDFIVIDNREESLDLSEGAVEYLCDRHFGIGADGLMLLRPASSPDADFAWWFRNSDGSIAEMCGNGIRCMAKFIADNGLVTADTDSVRIETLTGVRPITFTRDQNGRLDTATVDMGEPILDPPAIPTTFDGSMVFECPIDTDFGTFRVTAVSMGNPHAVIWVDDVEEAPVDTVGPLIETHPAFPKKTNVEFAQLMGDGTIRVRVWERGVGETLACGTGACATLVAATLACHVGREATIELDGGELHVRWDADEHVYMTGPAVTVFTGTFEVGEEGE